MPEKIIDIVSSSSNSTHCYAIKKILPSLYDRDERKDISAVPPWLASCPAHTRTFHALFLITAEVPAAPTRRSDRISRAHSRLRPHAGLPLPPARCKGCRKGTYSRSSTFSITFNIVYPAHPLVKRRSSTDLRACHASIVFLAIKGKH